MLRHRRFTVGERLGAPLRRRGPATRVTGRGFTLVELAVMIAIVGILSVLAAPSLSGLTNAQQNVAASRVRSAMIYAQEWAIGTTNDTWVAFDVGTDLISVHVEDPANPGKANRLTLADPLKGNAMTLQLGDSGVGLDSASFGSTAEVQFDSLGAPFDANGAALAADGTAVVGGVTVRVTKTTGLITVD